MGEGLVFNQPATQKCLEAANYKTLSGEEKKKSLGEGSAFISSSRCRVIQELKILSSAARHCTRQAKLCVLMEKVSA